MAVGLCIVHGVKDRFDGVEWKLWADDIKLRWGPAMDYYREELYFDIEFHQYMQFKFYEQWMQLKTYAKKKAFRSSVISRSMLQWTAQIPGPIRNCSS